MILCFHNHHKKEKPRSYKSLHILDAALNHLHNIFFSGGISSAQWGWFCVTKEWQMVDQAQRGKRRKRGERRQRGRPTVTKVSGVRGRGSICSSLRGHCGAVERPVAVVCVCCFTACGWIFISERTDFRTKRIYYS